MNEEFLKELGVAGQKLPLMLKEYLTLDEAAFVLGIKRSSLYYYLNTLKIQRHKFPLNRHTYIRNEDVARIIQVKEKPWTTKGKDAA